MAQRVAERIAEPIADEGEQEMVREHAAQFATVKTPDQSRVPHHGAVDPSGQVTEQDAAES
ncbi:MAG TPA: hypothetical protein VHA57_04795 [Actinomycetota bacterium]|nr:hypothetical protein [Actinomycetota bacterium]